MKLIRKKSVLLFFIFGSIIYFVINSIIVFKGKGLSSRVPIINNCIESEWVVNESNLNKDNFNEFIINGYTVKMPYPDRAVVSDQIIVFYFINEQSSLIITPGFAQKNNQSDRALIEMLLKNKTENKDLKRIRKIKFIFNISDSDNDYDLLSKIYNTKTDDLKLHGLLHNNIKNICYLIIKTAVLPLNDRIYKVSQKYYDGFIFDLNNSYIIQLFDREHHQSLEINIFSEDDNILFKKEDVSYLINNLNYLESEDSNKINKSYIDEAKINIDNSNWNKASIFLSLAINNSKKDVIGLELMLLDVLNKIGKGEYEGYLISLKTKYRNKKELSKVLEASSKYNQSN
ncbi:MAG: hypothetical protein KAI43_08735 [Candidatus Aureabacteria bacterium]|nr:hypothetical protein [Candidatus Auribacterota bacterium]